MEFFNQFARGTFFFPSIFVSLSICICLSLYLSFSVSLFPSCYLSLALSCSLPPPLSPPLLPLSRSLSSPLPASVCLSVFLSVSLPPLCVCHMKFIHLQLCTQSSIFHTVHSHLPFKHSLQHIVAMAPILSNMLSTLVDRLSMVVYYSCLRKHAKDFVSFFLVMCTRTGKKKKDPSRLKWS